MTRRALLFHHTHTPDSNKFERDVRDLTIDSHAADYIEMTRVLPRGINAIFIKTDHWKTDPEYFERLENKLGGHDCDITRFETHVSFEIEGSTGVVINGVEASMKSEKKHVTIVGLPLSDNELYYNLDIDEIVEAGNRAAWIAPAHVGMPFHQIPEEELQELFHCAEAENFDVALGYTTGYFSLYNRIARNEIPFRTSVCEYANQNNISLIPELDIHGVVPAGYAGCGVVNGIAVEKLLEGVLSTSEILAADLFIPNSYRMGISMTEFLRNYAVFLPLVRQRSDPEKAFNYSLPNSEYFETIDIEANTVQLP